LEQAEAGVRRVYFVDAAHFVQSAFLGFLWCFTRLFVRSNSGRQRFNVLGALCATTHRLTTVCNTGYINSESVCELLRKLAALPECTPTTVVLDNARYATRVCNLRVRQASMGPRSARNTVLGSGHAPQARAVGWRNAQAADARGIDVLPGKGQVQA
jgi:hypothetical protein